jgi:hypothetical protein
MDDEDREFDRWYGPWAPFTPPDVQGILTGLPAPWWIVGGWAIDAFTGRSREHHDIDVGFFKADLPAVLDHLAPDYCVWSNLSGTLRPLKKVDDLLEGCRQLWVRRDGSTPWLIDLAMTPHGGETWISPRDDQIRLPLDEVVFEGSHGIRYLRPEIVLAFKARADRPQDDADLAAVLPMLEPERRASLVTMVERVDPGHRWLGRIRP